jgi:hypothetical protein
MEPFVRYALFACIVASAADGVVISIVAFKYGLPPPSEDDPIALTHRCLFITQLGRAFAAVAFAATAVLAAAAMVSGGASTERQRQDVQALSQRLDEVGGLVRQMTEALDQALDRLEQRRTATTRWRPAICDLARHG